MPPKHRKMGEWNTARFLSWAENMGPNTKETVHSLLARSKVEQQAYRSCMGLLKLADKYSVERLELACARALSCTPNPTYWNVSAILASGQDKTPKPKTVKNPTDEKHSFIRGPEYYGGMSDAG